MFYNFLLFHGSVTVYDILNQSVIIPKYIVDIIKDISNVKWGCINVVLEGILVKMFITSISNVFVSISWHMHFSATSDQIMEVADSSCNIQSASDSTSL